MTIHFTHNGMKGTVTGVFVRWGGVGFHINAAGTEMRAAIDKAARQQGARH